MDISLSPTTWFHPKVLAAICLLVSGNLLRKSVIRRRTDDARRLKHPDGAHWLWGNELEAWETPDSEWYTKNTEKHGLVFAMKGALFHPNILSVSDPAALHYIFTNSQRFIKSTVQQPWMERLLGRGITWAEGAEHTRQRQMVAPYFTAARVKQMNDDVQIATEVFIGKFRQHVVSDSTFSPVNGLRLNILPWLVRPTLDIIGKVALGCDFGCGESSDAKQILEAYKELVDFAMTPPAFLGQLVLRAAPWISNLPLAVVQAQGKAKTLLKVVSRRILDDINRAGEVDLLSRNDLLGKLVQNTDQNNAVDVDMMLDQICVFVIGGHETPTTLLGMALLELVQHPEIQTSLRKEIMEFSGSGPGGMLSYDDVSGSSLPLLDAVCREALRMWPIGSHIERMAEEDDVIPLRFPLITETGQTLNAIRVRKGQIFHIPIVAINSNSQVWGSDGRKFDPYRWLEPGRLPPSSSLTGGINGHFAFIEGPRLCLGYRLAIFEFKVLLSALIKNFEFKATEDSIQTISAMTMQPFVRGQKAAGPQLPLFVKPVSV